MHRELIKTYLRRLLIFVLSLLVTFYIPLKGISPQSAVAQITTEDLLIQGIDKALIFDLEGAITDFSEVIQTQPDFARAYYQRGQILVSNIRYLKDIKTFTVRSGLGFQVVGDISREHILNKAISDFSNAIQLEPDYLDAYYQRAILYEDVGKYQLSIHDWNEIIRINPNHAIAYYRRAFWKRSEVIHNLQSQIGI